MTDNKQPKTKNQQPKPQYNSSKDQNPLKPLREDFNTGTKPVIKAAGAQDLPKN